MLVEEKQALRKSAAGSTSKLQHAVDTSWIASFLPKPLMYKYVRRTPSCRDRTIVRWDHFPPSTYEQTVHEYVCTIGIHPDTFGIHAEAYRYLLSKQFASCFRMSQRHVSNIFAVNVSVS